MLPSDHEAPAGPEVLRMVGSKDFHSAVACCHSFGCWVACWGGKADVGSSVAVGQQLWWCWAACLGFGGGRLAASLDAVGNEDVGGSWACLHEVGRAGGAVCCLQGEWLKGREVVDGQLMLWLLLG